MTNERINQVVQNNAVWCDSICQIHGKPGKFMDTIWVNQHETPRFYPNAVTLSKTKKSTEQIEWIQYLAKSGLSRQFGVKDSFCTLDLASLGFRILFQAEWIYRSASQPRPDTDIAGIHWVKLYEESELADWEAAWNSNSAKKMRQKQPRIFLSSLLANEDIAVIAGYQEHRIVAGAIANRAVDCVGLTNIFIPTADAENFLYVCIAKVIDIFPYLPIVGYETGQKITKLQTLNFEPLGSLRIWVR
ncbi:hypothetical protein [Nostoc sp. ChiQUE01b]|uniref:hypothetical protein n=1 Tax=Nostoc sp. ChiQUE01b TaxID=3075376 RepID=UPI002AD2960B|nr:hypothetical protein [Nostoc sp. ChiQUE01b]MDZ8260976.1 hypothetical protein [Nostoc sp. ChiQUE01b]